MYLGGLFMDEVNNAFQKMDIGSIVTGTVVKIEEKQVLVDIKYKTEGIIPISEISSLPVEHPSDIVTEGEELTLLVKNNEDKIILSKKAADASKTWDILEEKYKSNEIFETEIKEVVKGGLVTDVGLRGFIPASLVETFFVEDFSDYKGRNLEVKIVDLNKEQNRIILSHRAVKEADVKVQREELLQSLEVGQALEGTVQRLTSFGAFVDIGGIDGLVHISELAHEHVLQASEIVAVGEEIQVEVLAIDRDNERISLSRKKTIPGPWVNIGERLLQDAIVEGTVKRLVNFGAFVEIEPGLEGLVHISQIANRHIATPEEVLAVGENIQVKVLSIDEVEERISLSIKELEQDQAKAEYEQYEKDGNQSGFLLGDLIGDKLNKYK